MSRWRLRCPSCWTKSLASAASRQPSSRGKGSAPVWELPGTPVSLGGPGSPATPARLPLKILGLSLISPSWVMCSPPSQSVGGGGAETKVLIGQAWSHVLVAGGWASCPQTPKEGVREEGFPRARKWKERGSAGSGRESAFQVSDLCRSTSNFTTRRRAQGGRGACPVSHRCLPGASEIPCRSETFL